MATSVDLYLEIESMSTGALTAAKLNAASRMASGLGTWTLQQGIYGSPQFGVLGSVTGFDVITSADALQLPGPITVDGQTYQNATHTKLLSYSLQKRNQGATFTFASPKTVVVFGYYFTYVVGYNAAPAYVDGTLSFEGWSNGGEFNIQGGSVENLVARLNVHTGDGGSGDTDRITVQVQPTSKTYWVSQFWDGVNGIAKVGIYDPSNGFAQVGNISELTQDAVAMNFLQFGDLSQDDVGAHFPFDNYFGNVLIDCTSGIFPLIPPANIDTLTLTTLNATTLRVG